jgi:hypothetical protein
MIKRQIKVFYFIYKDVYQSSSKSKPWYMLSSMKSSRSLLSFLVGRPVPLSLPMKPVVLLNSNISSCSGEVTFSRTSGISFAPTLFSIALRTLKDHIIGGFLTLMISPSFIVLEGLRLMSPILILPFLHSSVAIDLVL